MRQLIAIILSFILIPILIRRKFKLNTTLLSAIITLGIISGIGFISLINIVKGVFLDSNSINTILTVIMVGILGGLMNYYGILDKVVETMLRLSIIKRWF